MQSQKESSRVKQSQPEWNRVKQSWIEPKWNKQSQTDQRDKHRLKTEPKRTWHSQKDHPVIISEKADEKYISNLYIFCSSIQCNITSPFINILEKTQNFSIENIFPFKIASNERNTIYLWNIQGHDFLSMITAYINTCNFLTTEKFHVTINYKRLFILCKLTLSYGQGFQNMNFYV